MLTRSRETQAAASVAELLAAATAGVFPEERPGSVSGQLETDAYTLVIALRDLVTTSRRAQAALEAGASQVSRDSSEVNRVAEAMAGQALSAAASAGQVSASVEAVAAATEELGMTIRAVSQHAAEAADFALRASSEAGLARRTVDELTEASLRVDTLVEMIKRVAAQTKLLALNATLEAARAGNAGHGFAVVAAHVKSLATESSGNAETVAASVEKIQGDSAHAARVLQSIGSAVERMTENQTAIASAVEEQTSATHEIGRSATEAAAGSRSIAANIEALARGFQIATSIAAESKSTAVLLGEAASELQPLLAPFASESTTVEPVDHLANAARHPYVRDGVTIIPVTASGDDLNHIELRGERWSIGRQYEDSDDMPGAEAGSCVAGDEIIVRFSGREIRAFGTLTDNHGQADVTIDGVAVGVVDQYGTGFARQEFYRSPQLENGEHELRMTLNGRKHPDASYFWFSVAKFDVR